MARVTTGAYQATGKKVEGQVQQSNFSRPAKVGVVKSSEALPPSQANPKPFVRPIMPGVKVPGMRQTRVGGISRGYPTSVDAGAHAAMPHQINSGE